ncbi:MAG TPA: hypothetical protein DCX53_00445 [Anaerolineae bacterium]|nr:hypothetical protein [Anaerolineae bacterium]
MGWWRELPYRGDGKPRNNKPKKRFRNMKKERRDLIVSILAIFTFFVMFSVLIIKDPEFDRNNLKTGAIIIVSLFFITLAIGILSFNKFRKGYDIDISDQPKRKRVRKHKNTID